MGNDTYTDYPRIVLRTFYPNEAVDLSEGDSFYSRYKGIRTWEFKGMLRERNIYQMLLDSIVGRYKNSISDQWMIIGFRIA